MLVIQNNGEMKNDTYTHGFLFNVTVTTNYNHVVVESIPTDVDINSHEIWNSSYSYNIYRCEEYKKVVAFAKKGRPLGKDMV